MTFLAFLVLLSAIAISACGAYFSIVGLKMLFVGGGVSIIVMGTALEVGKLITATFLKQKWKEINWMMKTYMVLATFALMVITSIGIYGYLSAGYTSTNITVQGYEQQIESNDSKIKELEKEIETIKKSDYNSDEILAVDANRKKFIEQKLQIVAQKNQQIENIRKNSNTNQDASSDITAAKQALELSKSSTESDITKELEQIKLYNSRLDILDKEVQRWMEEGTGGLFKKNGLDKAREVKNGQEKERNDIDAQIKASQDRIAKLREAYAGQVKAYNDRVSEIENRSKSQRGEIDASIKRLEKENEEIMLSIDAYNKESDVKVATLNGKKGELADAGKKKIVEYQKNIQEIKNETTSLKEKIVHTDVGTFKFIAKSFDIPLDKAVNYFIWMIMSVFDPLAISLVLAYNTMIEKKEKQVPSPSPTPTPTPTPTPSLSATLAEIMVLTPTTTETPSSTPTMTPEPTQTPSITPEPTPEPTPEENKDYTDNLREIIEPHHEKKPEPVLRHYEHFSRPQP